jgi:phosphoribosyl-ATP pyrophosphohydrolase
LQHVQPHGAGRLEGPCLDLQAGGSGDRRLAEEAADLLYHLLVLLAERGVDPALVLDVLDERAR